jgi:hypothetical protein
VGFIISGVEPRVRERQRFFYTDAFSKTNYEISQMTVSAAAVMYDARNFTPEHFREYEKIKPLHEGGKMIVTNFMEPRIRVSSVV